MSKKNRLETRERALAHQLERERKAQEKKANKALKAQAKVKKVTAQQPSKKTKQTKQQRRGLRIRKGVVIKGIKVTDAESKARVKALLKQQAEEKMVVDSDGEWEEVSEAEVVQMQS